MQIFELECKLYIQETVLKNQPSVIVILVIIKALIINHRHISSFVLRVNEVEAQSRAYPHVCRQEEGLKICG